ncbi:MAG TPA: hypothetical protein VN174_02775 [Candidatus Methanoperedens sp.]|nr:hypothetical protein [Candidatus Methanoperedens sp.]
MLNLGLTPTTDCQRDVIKYEGYNSIGIEYDSWFHDGGHADYYGDKRGSSSIVAEKLGKKNLVYKKNHSIFTRNQHTRNNRGCKNND